MHTPHLALLNLPGGTEWIIIGIVGLLLFGKRLPDVARSIGKSIVEFKKGMRDVREDIEKDTPSDALPRSDSAKSLPRDESSKNQDKSAAGV
jgi:sec-independent protein translocase protein TatA